jgi:glutathione S-transferase
MQLYCDPISTTSRPVLLFLAEHAIEAEIVHVDLLSGGQLDPAYRALNPNGVVPFLVDGDLKLGESSAILKYLADKVGSAAYPTELKARAKVNEALDWFSTQFHEYYCIFAVYPHMGVPHGMDPVLRQSVLAYGEQACVRWLKVLDEHMLGARPFVCGEEISLADYLGASFVTLGEIAAFDLSPYLNIEAWVARMKARPHWDQVYAGFYGLVAAIRAQATVAA